MFFVDATGNATRATAYALVAEGRVIFMVPPLPAGEYSMEVRRSYTQNIGGVFQCSGTEVMGKYALP